MQHYADSIPVSEKNARIVGLVASVSWMGGVTRFVCAVVLLGCGEPGEGMDGETDAGSSGQAEGDSVGPGSSASDVGSTSGATDAETTSGEEEESSSGETGEFPPPIDWEPCSFYTGGTDEDAECHTFAVPLDWDEPDGEQIDLFLKRLGGGGGSIQLYMLMGGPGGSGVGYEDDAEELLEQMPGLEVYLIDHRGTGRSSPLLDLDEALGEWGEGFEQFNTSNAARDLGWLIDRAREPGKDVQVFGASYGSYWAQRYLQLFPEQADGVTLLGIAAPGFNFNTWERDFNAAGNEFLALCDDDPVCSSRLGPDAPTRAFEILYAVSQGHCAEAGLGVDVLRTYFSTRVAWHWETRAFIPAILHRLDRCSAADVLALQNAAPQISDPFTFEVEPPAWSAVLGTHVRLSELTDEPIPSDEQLQTWNSTSLFTLGSTVGMGAQYAAWPRYEPDELDGGYAETNVPMLMLHGEFDPNAPLSQALPLRDHYAGPHQHFFVIESGLHSWPSPLPGGEDCMRRLFLDFMADPTADLEDCTEDVLPFDFDQDALAPAFFGTDTLWDS